MPFAGRGFKAILGAITTATLVASAIVLGSGTAALAADPVPSPPPFLQRDQSVVTGDPLPTVQIDSGYVWAQTTIGSTVYAVGQFENARAALAAPGTSLTPRTNILAFDINSGALLPFAPTVNGSIKAVAASPDGKRIYIGGSFNNVNGQTRWNIAALDAQTGQLVAGFAPSIGGNGVYALAADATGVYVGGLFTQANGTARTNLAAFATSNGALRTDWVAQPEQQVDAMIMDPDGQNVIVGGRFSNVNGDGKWRGLVSVNASNGLVNQAWEGTAKVKNGWGTGSNKGKAGIFALNRDGNAVYGTGWVFADAQTGNLEGVFSLKPSSGTTRWISDCLGDHYGVYSTGSVVYSTTHSHACSTNGLWPEQPTRQYKYVQAMTADARGTLSRQPHAGSTYVNWEGEAAPSAYAWYPDFFTGTASGLGQAGLSITGAGNVISIAGEFPGVNNRYFQGIVRFSSTPPGGAKDGPRTTTAAWGAPTASSVVPGRIRLSINGTWDRDDRDLTYELTRSGTTNPVASVTRSNGWWNVPTVSLTDTNVVADQSYTYRITVKDGDGNAVVSAPVTATASAGTAAEYTSAVLDDGANLYYPLGSSTVDWAGANPPVFGSGAQAQQPSAVNGSSTGFTNFTGSSTGRVSSSFKTATPSDFTAELWFKTTTNRGGKLLGYGNAQTDSSSSYDRHIYMRNDGRLNFGVYPGSTKVVTTTSPLNDGKWHHVAASLSTGGMKLFVDGQLAASDPTVSYGEGYSGYWRVGGDNLSSWPNAPTSNWFSGAIDEVAVYPSALTPSQIATHYAIGTGRTAPTASFTSAANELAVNFNGSGSTVSPGGTIANYSWDFGDGSAVASGASATTTHTFPATGTYTVTLTVRDDQGLIGSVSKEVSVLGPNSLPTASFTSAANGLTVSTDGTGSSDTDGTISSYSWNWGDGSAAGSGSLATHDYAAAGTYEVKLTVTDDRGGTATTSRQVTTTHDAPVATFSTSAAGLTVDVDASGSTASNGATLTYAWDWGDGAASSTGAQATHAYAADGTYDITVTATDSLGASSSVTHTVTVEATVYAFLDDFERVVSSGWGAAPNGGVWTTMLGSANVASVNGTHGVLNLAPGSTRQLAQQGLSLADTESTLDYKMGYGPATGTGYVGLTLRQTPTNGYTIQAWHRNNGTIWLVAQQGGTVIKSQAISGMAWAQGDEFTVKTEVSGSSPTTLRAKIWPKGGTEPQTWQLSATDSTSGLQQAGFVSVRNNVGSSSAAVGQVTFDRITIRDLGSTVPVENVPPVAAFTPAATGLSVTANATASSDADGTIASYAWNWGDGSPSSSGVSATHAYAAAGTYNVSLTVTDNDGATHSVSKPVTVTAPANNVPPVAAFTPTTTGLSVATDAAASADPDGTIASYAWDWGDGSPGSTGATATHAYAAAGQYTITLVITDNAGATGTTTQNVTVDAPPPAEFLLQDDFERSATSSWGAATIGGPWTISGGAASAASVADGKARLNLAAGSTRFAMLPQASLREYTAEVDFSTSATPDSGATYAGMVARDTGAGTYLVHAWLRPGGTVWLIAQQGSTVLQSSTLSGLTYAAGDTFTLKLEVSGTTATQINAKLWKVGTPEPANWQVAVQNTDPALQANGTVGLRASRTGASTTPAVVTFDRFQAKEIG